MSGRRIAVISEHASPLAPLGGVDGGGQNVYVGEVAKNLASFGYQVDIFTRRDNAMLPETAEWMNGVRIVQVPAGPARPIAKEELLPHMGAFTGFMERFCRRSQAPYDMLHANFWMSGLVAAELKRRLGIPFVVTFHALGRVRRQYQGTDDRFPEERFGIEDRIVRETERIVAECPQDEEDLIRLYGADPARIKIVPAGFDPAAFCPLGKELARSALGLAPREKVLLQLGRLVPRKGVDTAIRALALLRREHGIDARLLIVGGDAPDPDPEITPEIGRLRRVAEQEQVADFVTFVGARGRDSLRWYYSAADIFISTPWYEPFGITPVEAMACGTPVIGSNVGGIKFSVRDGETGYLVPPKDPSALAERLGHMYRNPKLLKTLGNQAVRRAHDLFNWQRITAEIAALYEEVLLSARPSTGGAAEHLAAVDHGLDGALATLADVRRLLRASIAEAGEVLVRCLSSRGRLLICGNGGSAADAQHFAAELVGRFELPDRPALPALALTSDGAVLTAWSNDRGFEEVFARQVRAFGCPNDVLVAISTSGRSPNVIRALEAARERDMATVALLGGGGGEAAPLADVAVIVPSDNSQHVQEAHIAVIHVWCGLIERSVALKASRIDLARGVVDSAEPDRRVGRRMADSAYASKRMR